MNLQARDYKAPTALRIPTTRQRPCRAGGAGSRAEKQRSDVRIVPGTPEKGVPGVPGLWRGLNRCFTAISVEWLRGAPRIVRSQPVHGRRCAGSRMQFPARSVAGGNGGASSARRAKF
jgi:hypothetical protein